MKADMAFADEAITEDYIHRWCRSRCVLHKLFASTGALKRNLRVEPKTLMISKILLLIGAKLKSTLIKLRR